MLKLSSIKFKLINNNLFVNFNSIYFIKLNNSLIANKSIKKGFFDCCYSSYLI